MKFLEQLGICDLEELYSEGEVFLNAKDGLKFIELCEKEQWAVIGVEGGFYDGEVFTPDSNLAEDYSSINFWNWYLYKQNCNLRATEFLKNFVLEDNLRFYLIFVNEHDFNKIVRRQMKLSE